jgi:hypothetical protein
MSRALARALLLSTVLVLMAPAAAWAGSATKRDKGGVGNRIAKRYDLTRAERAALDIASVKVIGKEGLGVLVEVTFRGNVERRLGRGHLDKAAVAMILRPNSRQSRATVLASRGAGLDQRLLRRSRSTKVGAIRDGRKLTFVIRGSGLSGVDAVEVKSFPKLPRPRRGARGAQVLDGGEAETIAASDLQADLAELEDELDDINPEELSCAELEDLLDDLDELSDELKQLSRGLGAARRSLNQALRRARRVGDMGEVADLQDALEELNDLSRQLGQTRAAVRELRDLVREELRACDAVDELAAVFDWDFFDPTEVVEQDGRFVVRRRVGPADVRSPITAVRVVVARQITNYLCPTQLPSGAVTTTSAANDTLTCSGGTLAIDEAFRMNLRTNPNPSSGMGGQLYGQQDGVFKGPFAITGP